MADCSICALQQPRMFGRQRCGVVRVRGTISLCVVDDLRRCRELLSAAQCRSLARYAGAVLLRQRKTSTASLNLIRSGALSQCRPFGLRVAFSGSADRIVFLIERQDTTRLMVTLPTCCSSDAKSRRRSISSLDCRLT